MVEPGHGVSNHLNNVNGGGDPSRKPDTPAPPRLVRGAGPL